MKRLTVAGGHAATLAARLMLLPLALVVIAGRLAIAAAFCIRNAFRRTPN